MVDWSGGADTGPRERKDAIWTALLAGDGDPATLYLRNRELALDWLSALVAREAAAGRRLLIGFDSPSAIRPASRRGLSAGPIRWPCGTGWRRPSRRCRPARGASIWRRG